MIGCSSHSNDRRGGRGSALADLLVDPDLQPHIGMRLEAAIKRGGGLDPTPRAAPLQRFHDRLKVGALIKFGAQGKDDLALRSGNADQLLKGAGRGVAAHEDPYRNDRVKVIR